MKPSAFLFDIGNVLIRFDFSLATAKLQGRSPRSHDELFRIVHDLIPVYEVGGMTTGDFLAEVVRQAEFDGEPAEFAAAYCSIFFENVPMRPLIERLARDYPLFLCSNTSELHQSYLFEHFPILSYFQDGIYSWKIGAMKPQRPIYEAACALIGHAPQRIIYVDDLPANVAAGRDFGFQSFPYDHADHAAFEALAKDW